MKKYLLAIILTFLFFGNIWAQPTEEELNKMKQALPEKLFVPAKKTYRLLVFSRTEGYRHACIDYGKKMLQLMAEKYGLFELEFNDSLTVFVPDSLNRFDAILLNSPTGNELPNPEYRQALLDFVKNGGGLIGLHSATDNFYTWPQGARLLGGVFDQHPWTSNGTWRITIEDKDHPLTQMFQGQDFDINDEIYRIRPFDLRKNCRVLLRLDITDAKTRAAKGVWLSDRDLPVSWIRTFKKGRVFYCSLGHNPHIYWNPTIVAHYLAGIQFALGNWKVDTTPRSLDLAQLVQQEEIEQLLKAMASYKYGQSRNPMVQFNELLTVIVQNKTLSHLTENLVVASLQDPNYSLDAKQFLCEKLSQFGTTRSLPALAKLLEDESSSAMALYTLERLPGLAVDQLLRQKFDQIPAKDRPAALAALGHRKDKASEKFLLKKLKEKDSQLQEAALKALAHYPSTKVANTLFKLAKDEKFAHRSLALDVLLSMAAELENRSRAEEIYLWLLKSKSQRHWLFAALKGLVEINPTKGFEKIIEAVGSENSAQISSAIQVIAALPATLDFSPLIKRFAQLSQANQIQLMVALGPKSNPAMKSWLMSLLNHPSSEVRLQAVKQLRFQQGADLVSVVAAFAAEHQGVEKKEARETLNRLPGKEIDAEIVRLLPESSAEVKIELIRAIGQRNIVSANESLLTYLNDPQAKVRLTALKALQQVGQPAILPSLAARFSNQLRAKEAKQLSRTLLAVLRKAANPASYAEILIAQNEKLTTAPVREVYLETLAKSGLEAVLPVLKIALQTESEDMKATVLSGLADWPDEGPLLLLQNWLKQNDSPRLKALALRSYLKLVAALQNLSPEQKLNYLKFGLHHAQSLTEKRNLLSALSEVGSWPAFEICGSFLKDQSLKSEAQVALIKIAEKLPLSVSHQALPVLEKIKAEMPDGPLKNQLNKTLENLYQWAGFITDWQLAGPYSGAGEEPLDRAFPPETAAKVDWKVLTDNGDPKNYWHVNLAQLFGGNNKVVYLKSEIYSPQEQQAVMEVGSDDYVKVWLNGKLVHTFAKARGVVPGQDKVPVTLQKGKNIILMKVVNLSGGWGSCLRFVDLQGRPIAPEK